MAILVAQFYSEFFSDLNEVVLNPIIIGGEKRYRIVEKTKDGKKILTPFIICPKVFQETGITEIIGLTWNLIDKYITTKDVEYKYHPIMETACERYSKDGDNSVIVCRIFDSLRKGKCSCDMPGVEDDFFLDVLLKNL